MEEEIAEEILKNKSGDSIQEKRKRNLKMISIKDLPNEIFVEIFSFLPIPFAISNITPISKRFNSLIKNPVFYKLWKKNAENSCDFTNIDSSNLETLEGFKKEFDKLMNKDSIEYINDRLKELYPEDIQIVYQFDEEDSPIIQFYVYRVEEENSGRFYWHVISYGQTKPKDDKEGNFPKYSFEKGKLLLGHEFSMRIYETTPSKKFGEIPVSFSHTWCLELMVSLSNYQSNNESTFDEGHYVPCHGSIGFEETLITTIAFRLDPELKKIRPYNLEHFNFLELCGITDEETEACRLWDIEKTLEMIYPEENPAVLDLKRKEKLGKLEKEIIFKGMEKEGSKCGLFSFLNNCEIKFNHPKKEKEEEKRNENQQKKNNIRMEIWKQTYMIFMKLLRIRIIFNEVLEVFYGDNQKEKIVFLPKSEETPLPVFDIEDGVKYVVIDQEDMKDEINKEKVHLEYENYEIIFKCVEGLDILPFQN